MHGYSTNARALLPPVLIPGTNIVGLGIYRSIVPVSKQHTSHVLVANACVCSTRICRWSEHEDQHITPERWYHAPSQLQEPPYHIRNNLIFLLEWSSGLHFSTLSKFIRRSCSQTQREINSRRLKSINQSAHTLDERNCENPHFASSTHPPQ